MAKMRTSSREDAMKIARYVGCTGAHQDDKGNWLPCASPEKLAEISEQAAEKSALKRDKKKRRRFINKNWEYLGERGIMGIDTIEGGGLVSGKAETICPPATSSIALNLKNRQNAIDTAGYGPLNPKEPNTDFWEKKAKRWSVTIEDSKKQTCGNCAAFIKTPRMLDCIDKGLGNESGNAAWDVIDAGDLGYCEAFDFKCASARTCDAWISGGPVTEEKNTTEEKAATSTIIIGRAKPRLGDPDVYTDPNSARLRARKLGCIGIARRETPDGEIVWTPCTNVSDQRRRQGETPLGRRDEARKFADMLQEVGGPSRKRQRMRKYKTLAFSVGVKAFSSIGGALRAGVDMPTIGRNLKRAGKCNRMSRGIRSIRDGDGDGFICNPATGEDDLPIVGNNEQLRNFYNNAMEAKKTWGKLLKQHNQPNVSFNTPGGAADEMLTNLKRRGWYVYKENNNVKLIPPPEFRKRYLAMRAIRGQGAVTPIEELSVGYHVWHPGNDREGPEKELSKHLLKNYGYDPYNDTLYSPYYNIPNTWGQIKNPKNIRPYSWGVIPEFEGAPNAQKYLTDKPGVHEFKKPSIIDESLARNTRYLDATRQINQFFDLLEVGKGKYGNKDKDRSIKIDDADSAEEINDFFALNDAGYGYDEIAEILNLDEEKFGQFLTDEGFTPEKGFIRQAIADREKDKRRRIERRARLNLEIQRAIGDGPRAPKYEGFREGAAATPPKLDIDPSKGVNEPVTYDEYAEALKWMAYQDNHFKPAIRNDVLKRQLEENPRLSLLVQMINGNRWKRIMGQDAGRGIPEFGKKRRLGEELGYQYFERNIDKILSGANGQVPKEFVGLGVNYSDLRNVIDIISTSDDAEKVLRETPRYWELYDELLWLGLMPRIDLAPRVMQMYAQRRAVDDAAEAKLRTERQASGNVFATPDVKSLNGAKTPAKPSERVFGSSQNPEGSASSTTSASDISLDDSTEASLARKVSEHNDKMRSANKPAWSMASIAKLKAVYRRGAGAFSTSHRPGMTRNQWAMGRVNAFLKMLSSGRPNSGKYVGDNDLLHQDHPWKNRGVRKKSALYSDSHIEFKALPTIGGGIGGRLIRRPGMYDPNAFDGDEDGRVQDGTQFERPAPPAKKITSLVELYERVKDPDGGFTFSMNNMDDVKSGWAIARKGQGIKVPASTVFDKDGNVTDEGIDYLEAFIEMNREGLLGKPDDRKRVSLGAWHNPEDGVIYFDITDVHFKDKMTLEQALEEGKRQDQISLADLDELHAAIEDGDWDSHVAFHSTGGSGKNVLPDEKFSPYLEAVRQDRNSV